jgi:hypothetical protein
VLRKRFFASSPRSPKKRYAIPYLFCTIPCWLQYIILSSDRCKGLRENGLVCSQGTSAPVCCESENNARVTLHQWNTPSIDFYEKRLKAIKMDDWVGMRLDEDGIKELTKLAP